ncbi:hypothetical protein DJ83_16975 [Halorubrum ezzemoulense]|uniref:Uncharacterized protein n=1 Tax=Halorubrum ezzemoulense TaxID=337243 RepID=A0A256ILH9_HALEZ|nr:hypothetical protein [Halorubrum ezzemoulense]OYR57418.1 hypothetical protein DJ83_16975 [Halorubrum ezzemoulense]
MTETQDKLVSEVLTIQDSAEEMGYVGVEYIGDGEYRVEIWSDTDTYEVEILGTSDGDYMIRDDEFGSFEEAYTALMRDYLI